MKGKRAKKVDKINKLDIMFYVWVLCVIFQIVVCFKNHCIGSIYLLLQLIMVFVYKDMAKMWEKQSDKYFNLYIKEFETNLEHIQNMFQKE